MSSSHIGTAHVLIMIASLFLSIFFRAGGNYSVIFQKNLDHYTSATPVSILTPQISLATLTIGMSQWYQQQCSL